MNYPEAELRGILLIKIKNLIMGVTNLEKLIKLLPLGTLLLIIFSSVKLILYYWVFDVPIIDFVEVGELITSFIDDILYYLLIFGLNIPIYFILQKINQPDKLKLIQELKIIEKKGERNIQEISNKIQNVYIKLVEVHTTFEAIKGLSLEDTIIEKKINFENWLKDNEKDFNDYTKLDKIVKRLENEANIQEKIVSIFENIPALASKKKRIKNTIILIIILILILTTVILIPLNFSSKFMSLSLVSPILAGFVLNNIYFKTRDTFFTTLLLSTMVLKIIFDTFQNAYELKENIDQKQCEIVLENTTRISTNKNILYLGKTKEYLFIYDKSEKASQIFKMSKIESIKIIKTKKIK